MGLRRIGGVICLFSVLLHVVLVAAQGDPAGGGGAGGVAAAPEAGGGAGGVAVAPQAGGGAGGVAVAPQAGGGAEAGGGGGLLGGFLAGLAHRDGGGGGAGGGGLLGAPSKMMKAGMNNALNHLEEVIMNSPLLQEAKKDPRTTAAHDVCMNVLDRSMKDLQRTLERMHVLDFDLDDLDDRLFDLKVWLSSASKGQNTCCDAFEKTSGEAGERMKELLKVSKELTVTTFNMIDTLGTFLRGLQSMGVVPEQEAQGQGADAQGQSGSTRRLLQVPLPPDQVPAWVKPNWKNLLAGDGAKAKAHAVVAANGSGKFKTINDAVKSIPPNSPEMYIIYIKEGVYAENVVIGWTQTNVMVVGDGPEKTKITGSRSEKRGYNTLQSATFGVDGFNFLVKDVGFENTAAATEGPAVALRIAADKAVVINCKMDGNQDTLFAQVYRQYYRDCQISGTIDFVFGGSVSIFQNCHIMARKPAVGQADLVLAQNREFANDISGIVLDGCTIKAEPALASDKGVMSYLGRPWKEYSRMIVMNSDIDGFINPSGWDIWLPNKPNTQNSYIAEYNNKGPGADISQRVKWPSYKKLSPTEAATYCPSTFLKADSWLPPTGVSPK